MRCFIIFLLLCFSTQAKDYVEYYGKVVEVTDGDTFVVNVKLPLKTSREIEIRMEGVNAPEKWQYGGTEATNNLKKLLPEDTKITIQIVLLKSGKERMTFNRYVAQVWKGDKNICDEMNLYLNSVSR